VSNGLRWIILACLTLMALPTYAVDNNAMNKLAEDAAIHIKDKAENVQPPVSSASTGTPDALSDYHDLRLEQERNKLIEVMILCLLTLISLVIVLSFLSKSPSYSSSDMVNVTGLIFIISGTIILVIMADTEQQLTAAMGILGAVAGYLFGTMRKGSTKE